MKKGLVFLANVCAVRVGPTSLASSADAPAGSLVGLSVLTPQAAQVSVLPSFSLTVQSPWTSALGS